MNSHLLSGAFSKRDTPSSFPNLEVKPLSSDDTALYESGKVGQCHFRFSFFYTHFNILYLIILLIQNCSFFDKNMVRKLDQYNKDLTLWQKTVQKLQPAFKEKRGAN